MFLNVNASAMSRGTSTGKGRKTEMVRQEWRRDRESAGERERAER